MERRFGFYCANIPVNNAEEENKHNDAWEEATHCDKRCSLAPLNVSAQAPNMHCSDFKKNRTQTNKVDIISTDTVSTKSGVNQAHRKKRKGKRAYVTPSTCDIIIGSVNRHGCNIEFKAYVKTLYAEQYYYAETSFEKSLIVCSILDSVKRRGGRLLKESFTKQGMYYEMDDFYSIKKIEEALNQTKVTVRSKEEVEELLYG